MSREQVARSFAGVSEPSFQKSSVRRNEVLLLLLLLYFVELTHISARTHVVLESILFSADAIPSRGACKLQQHFNSNQTGDTTA